MRRELESHTAICWKGAAFHSSSSSPARATTLTARIYCLTTSVKNKIQGFAATAPTINHLGAEILLFAPPAEPFDVQELCQAPGDGSDVGRFKGTDQDQSSHLQNGHDGSGGHCEETTLRPAVLGNMHTLEMKSDSTEG